MVRYGPVSQPERSKEPDLAALAEAVALVKTDVPAAKAKFEALVERGSIHSMVWLGTIYSWRVRPPNYELAAAWYQRASDAGSIDGGFRAGVVYSHLKKYDLALEAFERGAEHGYGPSLYLLARAYSLGRGVKVDFNKAINLLWQADKAGHLLAKRLIGQYYMMGKAGIWNMPKGLALYVSSMPEIGRVYREDRSDERLRTM